MEVNNKTIELGMACWLPDEVRLWPLGHLLLAGCSKSKKERRVPLKILL